MQPNWVDYVLAFATVAAVVVALFLARWGYIWQKTPKETIRLVNWKPTVQRYSGSVLYIHRLIVKNDGDSILRDLHCNLVRIDELKDGRYQERTNFIPVPLNWTNINQSSRVLAIEETGLLDIVEHASDMSGYKICWAGRQRPEETDLWHLPVDKVMLYLSFYATRYIGSVKLTVDGYEMKIANVVPTPLEALLHDTK